MTDSVTPITYDRTFFSGVMSSNAVGKGRVEKEQIIQTIYPNGQTVTRIYQYEVEVYDVRAVVSRHNQPPLLDLMA